jgi:MGT family glycosyltransferase
MTATTTTGASAVRRPRRFLIVTWEAGGGIHPALGIGRLLASRGHDVRILAPRTQQERVRAAGCDWRPFPAEMEFDPTRGRAAEDQRDHLMRTFLGDELPAALVAELGSRRPDALVVDALLASTLCTAQAHEPPVAALVHTLRAFHGNHDMWGDWGFDEIDALCAKLGLEPLPRNQGTAIVELQRRCELELVVMPAEFDARTDADPNTVHVGPIFEDGATTVAPAELPWSPGDATPLVVVGLSSTYMRQEGLLERILAGLATLPVHVLATTGPELDPAEVRAPAGIELRRYVPHSGVLPRADLVITHAGTGTLMAAAAHGVPSICIPLGRDQPTNATRAADLGIAVALPPDAEPGHIASTVRNALASNALRAAANDFQALVAAYGEGVIAAETLERLAHEHASRT